MKVLLVLPWHRTDMSYRSKFSNLFTYPPLTLGTIAAIIERERPDWQIEAVDEISGKIKFDAGYDLEMVTSTTSTAYRAFEIGDKFKEKGAYVCLGGYHTSYNPDETLEHADTVFTGPGEYTIPQFIRDLEAGSPQKKYVGHCVAGKDIIPADRSKISHRNYLKYPAVIANPGCPNRCSYCSISDMWRDTTARPIEDVIAEIRSLKSKILVFFDPNFFGNREYSIKLMKALKPLKKRWVASATIDVGFDEEIMTIAADSGCNGLLVGLESLNQKALCNMRKGFNKAERYKEAIDNLKAHGIMVNGCFVLGMDYDTEEELLDLPRQVDYLGLNLARFSILTPVPGTGLFDELDKAGRIISRNLEDYSQHKAVFKPDKMSPERLEQIYRYVWKETYSFKYIFRRVKRITAKGLVPRVVGFGANLGFRYLGME